MSTNDENTDRRTASDGERQVRVRHMQNLIDEARASGVSERSFDDIRAEARRRVAELNAAE